MTSLRRSARRASRSRTIPQCAAGSCPLRGLGCPRRDRPKMIDPDDTCRACHERQHALQASRGSSARSVGSGSQSASPLRVGLAGIADRSACIAAHVFSKPCSITPSASAPTTNPRSSCSSRSAARSSCSTASAMSARAPIINASMRDSLCPTVAASAPASAQFDRQQGQPRRHATGRVRGPSAQCAGDRAQLLSHRRSRQVRQQTLCTVLSA